MLAYFDKATAPLAGVPAALRDRRFVEYIRGLSAFGIRFGGAADDSAIQYDVSKSTPEQIYQFLEQSNVICVDLGPEDLVPYAGVSRGTDVGKVGLMAAQRLLATDQQAQLSVSRILPGEIPDRVAELFLQATFSGPQQPQRPDLPAAQAGDEQWVNEQEEQQIVEDLRRAGVGVEDRWDEPLQRDPDLDRAPTREELDLTPTDDWGV